MTTQPVNHLEVFVKNIGTAFDRFFKPYDLLYSLQNTQHISVEVKVGSKDSILEYYTRVTLTENQHSMSGRTLVVKAKNVTLDKTIEAAKTITFEKNKYATLKKELKSITANSFETIILPEVLNNVLEYAEVIKECYRILKPGGSVLATAATISTPNLDNFWGFTASGFKYMFSQDFKPANLLVRSYGNALVGRFFLEQKKAADLSLSELNYSDLYFPVVVAVRATK